MFEAQLRTYRAIKDLGAAIDSVVDCTPELTPEWIDETVRHLRDCVEGAFAVPAIRVDEACRRRGHLRLVRGRPAS